MRERRARRAARGLRMGRDTGSAAAGASGFTLTEVMVAVGIVAILASIALPQYRKTVETAYKREAEDLLMTIYYGERAYFVTNSKYVNPAPNWNEIYMEDPNLGSIPVAFSVTAPGPTFTASAQRGPGGPCANNVLQIDQTRKVSGSWCGCPGPATC